MSENNLKNRIEFLVNEAGGTQDIFLRKLDCDMPTQRLRDLIGGRVKKLQKHEFEKICEVFDVNPNWLGAGEGDIYLNLAEFSFKKKLDALKSATSFALKIPELTGLEKRQIQELVFGLETKSLDSIRSALGSIPDYVKIPKYDIAASAGVGTIANAEVIVEHLAFKREWIAGLGLDVSHIALIDVKGDSMTPTISETDLLLLDTRPQDKFCEGVYVIVLNDSLLVKRLSMPLTGGIDVTSDNPHYPKQSISVKNLADLKIVGRVVWHGGRV